jgi:hypothetical protein
MRLANGCAEELGSDWDSEVSYSSFPFLSLPLPVWCGLEGGASSDNLFGFIVGALAYHVGRMVCSLQVCVAVYD